MFYFLFYFTLSLIYGVRKSGGVRVKKEEIQVSQHFTTTLFIDSGGRKKGAHEVENEE